MAFVARDNARPVIDLAGPEGNAFVLLGRAREYGRQLGFAKERIDAISAEMKGSDYKNLVTVFDREFGEYVDLILPENGL